MILTIFGSCRQDSLYSKYLVTEVKELLSYPHYSKEVLEVIKFILYGHISPADTVHTFRTPILYQQQVSNTMFTQMMQESDVFVIEIASKLAYKYNDSYVHHILYDDDKFNTGYKDKIQVLVQDDDEIEKDILEIRRLLQKPIVIVGHITTYNHGSRYELVCLLEKICAKHNIIFINPVKELIQRGYKIENLTRDEPVLAHYNHDGHSVMREIYAEFIDKAKLQC